MAVTLDVANVGQLYSDVTGATAAITTGSAVASGAVIVLCVRNGGNPESITVSSATDNGGTPLTWVVLANVLTAAGQNRCTFVYARAPSGLASGKVITVTYSGTVNAGRGIVASSYLGVSLAKITSATFTGTTQTYSHSMSPTNPGALLIVAASEWGGNVHTPTSPSVEDNELTGQVTCRRFQDAGTFSVGGDFTAGVLAWGNVAVLFDGAAGGVVKTFQPLPFFS